MEKEKLKLFGVQEICIGEMKKDRGGMQYRPEGCTTTQFPDWMNKTVPPDRNSGRSSLHAWNWLPYL